VFKINGLKDLILTGDYMLFVLASIIYMHRQFACSQLFFINNLYQVEMFRALADNIYQHWQSTWGA
jgi:hypothetical protein